jgi:hypothetical protein
MRNVTNLLYEYLEAKRHLWNVHFIHKVRSLRESGPLDRYEAIDRLLFYGLVLEPLNHKPVDKGFKFGLDPFASLKVVPRKGIDKLVVMVSDEITGGNRTWNHPVTISAKGAEFAFIEFFDWNRYGYVSYPYYMARVTKCAEFPNYRDHDCLIETKDADVFCRATNG